METLVLKCREAANNSELRMMNELRIKLVSTGNNSYCLAYPKKFNNSYPTDAVKIKVLSGDATIGDGGATSYDQVVSSGIKLKSSSGVSDVSIVNFDLFEDCLGNPNSAFFQNAAAQGSISAQVILTTKEISRHDQIKGLNAQKCCLINGDISLLKSLSALEMINIEDDNTNSYKLTGSIDSLAGLQNLNKIYIAANFIKHTDVVYTVEGLNAIPNLTHFVVCGSNNGGGGDIYSLFANKTEIDFYFRHSNYANFDCSYISGVSEIPETKLTLLDFYNSKGQSEAFMRSVLEMVQDGLAAGKITLSVLGTDWYSKHIRFNPLTGQAWNNVASLVSDLNTTYGCVVTRQS